jgi:hypothetical protein
MRGREVSKLQTPDSFIIHQQVLSGKAKNYFSSAKRDAILMDGGKKEIDKKIWQMSK